MFEEFPQICDCDSELLHLVENWNQKILHLKRKNRGWQSRMIKIRHDSRIFKQKLNTTKAADGKRGGGIISQTDLINKPIGQRPLSTSP